MFISFNHCFLFFFFFLQSSNLFFSLGLAFYEDFHCFQLSLLVTPFMKKKELLIKA